MGRVVIALVLLVGPLLGAIKLYLADGGHHVVREYEVKTDRVRFYSTERSQWEEMPLELVDLERTRSEIEEQEAARKTELEFWQKEEEADRAHRREVSRVPMDTGVYVVAGEEIKLVPQAELEVVTNKKRSILKAITPIPVVAGKQIVWLKGLRAPTVVGGPAPEFYLRLYREERFGIIRLKPDKKKDMRQVEEWAVAPVTNEIIEQHDPIEIFRRQVDDNLYKIWPEEPLEPGEYAVVEFSPGEANIQVWDFSWPGLQ